MSKQNNQIPPEPPETLLNRIARKYLQRDDLITRNSDGEDFTEHAVWSLRAALEDAWRAGWEARGKTGS